MNLDELKSRAQRAGWDIRDIDNGGGANRMLFMSIERKYLDDDGKPFGFPAYSAHVSVALDVCRLINEGRGGYSTSKTYSDEEALWKAMQGARRRVPHGAQS